MNDRRSREAPGRTESRPLDGARFATIVLLAVWSCACRATVAVEAEPEGAPLALDMTHRFGAIEQEGGSETGAALEVELGVAPILVGGGGEPIRLQLDLGSGNGGLAALLGAVDRLGRHWSDERELALVLESLAVAAAGIPSEGFVRVHYVLPDVRGEATAAEDRELARAWGGIYERALRRDLETGSVALAARVDRARSVLNAAPTLEGSPDVGSAFTSAEAATQAFGLRSVDERDDEATDAAHTELGRAVAFLLRRRVGASPLPIPLDVTLDVRPGLLEAPPGNTERSETVVRVHSFDGLYRDVEPATLSWSTGMDDTAGVAFLFEAHRPPGVDPPGSGAEPDGPWVREVGLRALVRGEELVLYLLHRGVARDVFGLRADAQLLDAATTDVLRIRLTARPRPSGSWRIAGPVELVGTLADLQGATVAVLDGRSGTRIAEFELVETPPWFRR